MLEISPSYLNQIEHDVRPLTVAVLLRITEVFGVDATFFASQDDTRLVAELREVTMDRDLDIDADLHELDTAAEDLTIRMRMHRGDLAGELSDRLTAVHGVHILKRIDLGDTVL